MRSALLSLALCAVAACSDAATSARPPVDAGCSAPLTLRVGEVQTLSGGPALSCISLASTTAAEEYVLATANVQADAAGTWEYRIGPSTGGSLATSGTPRAPGAAAVRPAPRPYADDWSSRIEDGVRREEQRLLAGRELRVLASAARAPRPDGALLSGQVPRVGDVLTYRVGNAAAANFCASFAVVQATVKAIGTRVVVAQDVAAPARGYGDDDFRAIAAEFDQLIHPVDTRWFGETPDVNGDQRITILFTPAINRLSPPGVTGFVGGFFFVSDLLPRSIPSQQWQCDASNEQEIIYVFTPDPDGTINGNRHTVSSARELARGVIAHELQHMINHAARQSPSRPGAAEATWLNEGLSHFAEEVVGRASRGYGDSRRLGWNDVLFELDDFDSFFRQNLLRARSWMEHPELASPIGATTSTLAPRGAAWALVRYAVDHYSTGDAAALTRALVAGPEVGVSNLEARARTNLSEILAGFLIANVGAASASGLSPRYRYASWDMRDVMMNLNGGVDPLLVTPLTGTISGRAPAGSASFYSITRPASAGAVAYRVRSPSGASVDFPDARVLLLRVK